MPTSVRELAPSPRGVVKSLAWSADDLVDHAAGGVRWRLDGSVQRASVAWTYRFDAALESPSLRHALVYERCGTKAILVDSGRARLVRELDRSFYCAGVFDYPITFATLPDGREVVVHCPGEFGRLEIDDVATGERLTASTSRKPVDVFHSRLAPSPDGRHVLSVGWC